MQRGLVTEIIRALEGWRKGQADAANGREYLVETPDLHHSEFNCNEVVESALAAVRKNADESGAKILTTLVGPIPEIAYGNAQSIHQLITMLAASLPNVGNAENSDLRLSFEAKQNGTVEMLLTLLLSPTGSHETVCQHLTTLTETSASLQTSRAGGAELTLTSAWQLVLALGGSPCIETTADQKVRVQISLPLQATVSSFASEKESKLATAESNGGSGQPSDSSLTALRF
jgi:hypothetical protein